jgi:diguanylate cyclase (GGDEF)-like protein
VNDEHGHLAGDAVLRATANRISVAIRTMDVFAHGGEEFMLILPRPPPQRCWLPRRCAAICDKLMDIGNAKLQITASVGACAARTGFSSYEALIRGADSALYIAKQQGRNCSVRFDPPA